MKRTSCNDGLACMSMAMEISLQITSEEKRLIYMGKQRASPTANIVFFPAPFYGDYMK